MSREDAKVSRGRKVFWCHAKTRRQIGIEWFWVSCEDATGSEVEDYGLASQGVK